MIVKYHAYVSFDGAAGGPAVAKAVGVAVARTAAGVYTLTLDAPVDVTNVVYDVMVANGGAEVGVNITDTSDSVKTLNAFDPAGAATDAFTARVLISGVLGGGVGGG